MKNEKDKWEEFKDLPETYETNDNLVPKVKYEIFREKHTKRRFHWQAIAASVTLVAVGFGLFIPVYLSNHKNESEDERKYYKQNELLKSKIEDINFFLEEKGLNILYYKEENIISQSWKIVETNELAFISQDMFYRTEEETIDNVSLKVQLKTDCNFEGLNEYNNLPQETYISDIYIEYFINSSKAGKEIFAKFIYENIPYYLEVETANETGKLENYINMLLEDDEETYLDDGEIINSKIEDPISFTEENNLNILYYPENINNCLMNSSTKGNLEETGELTFFNQSLLFFTQNMEMVDVSVQILLLPDKKFNKLKSYENLPDSIMISGIQVEYGYTDKGQRKVALVKFTYNGLPYFLDIQADDLEGKVEYYVGLLLSGAENSLVT